MTQHYVGNDEHTNLVNLSLKHNLPMLLIGPTGTGKTTLIQSVMQDNDLTLHKYSVTGETTVDDFVGKYTLQDGNTVWVDGLLVRAMKNGDNLLLDEVNAGSPEVLMVLQSVLDHNRSLTITQHDGEVVKAHKKFRVFATMNPPGGEYSGTRRLNTALMNRFSITLYIDYARPEVERDIITSGTKLPAPQAVILVDTANNMRRLHKENKVTATISTRDLLAWATLASKLSNNVIDGYKHTISHKLDQSDRELFESALKSNTEKSDMVASNKKAALEMLEQMGKSSLDIETLMELDHNEINKLHESLRTTLLDKKTLEQQIMEEFNALFKEKAQTLKDKNDALKFREAQLEQDKRDEYNRGYAACADEMKAKLGFVS